MNVGGDEGSFEKMRDVRSKVSIVERVRVGFVIKEEEGWDEDEGENGGKNEVRIVFDMFYMLFFVLLVCDGM